MGELELTIVASTNAMLAATAFEETDADDSLVTWQQALGIEALVSLRALEVDIAICDAIISSCGKNRRWDTAMDILATLGSKRLVANLLSWNSVIAAGEQAEKWGNVVAMTAQRASRTMEALREVAG